MQVDDVCPLKLGELGDVGACVGYVHLKEVLSAEVVGNEDA